MVDLSVGWRPASVIHGISVPLCCAATCAKRAGSPTLHISKSGTTFHMLRIASFQGFNHHY
eukprot:6177955-Pleurochrysis_carterae.AAC.14